ncbi:Poly-beta-1,6-N-acetyl-D-glucosamine synthase [Dermatophilus congolensis]|uniref:Poly-beta-1,6-N-acetyl-D-glucosamine synthase n=1 Tax=Dermatophilus congolensis TaxID=1863 RepID=A0AA46H0T1_9MICO|nr:glycosyltransferase family 2 protein [Dermatophilus congolensis]STD11567.1 Poly-beta-1,6-N-acetyl-D-glucosamine synthase [Dermatophilus congolensis]
MSELVSVIMPVLNESASVEGAVKSILSQEGVDVEVLVVDGRSSDDTAAIVRRLASQDERVRLLDNPKVVIPSGLNVGLAAARGSFVARVDGHATITPGYFAQALKRFAENPKLAAVGGLRTGVSSTPTGRAIGLVQSSPFAIGDSINHFGTEYQLTDHASFGVYRADVARQVGGWDENLMVNEDVDFDHRIALAGYEIGFDPQMGILWHVRDNVPDLFRQYRRYGRGKALMVRKNGREALRPRHLAAPVAVMGTVALAALASRHPRLALAGYAPYLGGLAVASAKALKGREDSAPVDVKSLPLAFAGIHYGWGVGFLEGYVLGKQPRRTSGRDNSDAE